MCVQQECIYIHTYIPTIIILSLYNYNKGFKIYYHIWENYPSFYIEILKTNKVNNF